MDNIVVNNVTYWLPESNLDVITLVNEAKAANEVICVRGAAHSFPLIGTLEKGSSVGTKYKYLMLSKMNTVTITGSKVKVQAGCSLGGDPWDPTGISKDNKSLLYQLDQQGLSIPDLGGITHQSVGGFLSTASSGGSTKYSFEAALESVDIVTCEKGVASVRTFNKSTNLDDPFYGVGIGSLGLFGVIVSATFNCTPSFFIAGQEATSTVDDCEIDLFKTGGTKPSLQQYFADTEYTRLIWWPQENVKKMVVWKAWQATKADALKWASKKGSNGTALNPYQEVPWLAGSSTPANVGADFLFSAIGRWPHWLLDVMGNTVKYKVVKSAVDALFFPVLLPKILDIFVKVDGDNGPQKFSDTWYTGLPMDNQMSDRLMTIWFTELWISIDQSQEVMSKLRTFYDASTDNTGTFSCEIYATGKNSFWLSPAYNQDVIRIDVFWFAHSDGDPIAFYEKFWTLLAEFNFRPHWGKYLPAAKGPQGVAYLKNNYPKWDAWKALRDSMDPHQVFVNDYWREHLDIPNLK